MERDLADGLGGVLSDLGINPAELARATRTPVNPTDAGFGRPDALKPKTAQAEATRAETPEPSRSSHRTDFQTMEITRKMMQADPKDPLNPQVHTLPHHLGDDGPGSRVPFAENAGDPGDPGDAEADKFQTDTSQPGENNPGPSVDTSGMDAAAAGVGADQEKLQREKEARIDAEANQRRLEREAATKAQNPERIFANDLKKDGIQDASDLAMRYRELLDNRQLDHPDHATERDRMDARLEELKNSNPDAHADFQRRLNDGISVEDEKTFLSEGIEAEKGVEHFMDKTKEMSDTQAKEYAKRYGINPDRLQLARDIQKLEPGDAKARDALKDRAADLFKGEDGGAYEKLIEDFARTDDPETRQHLMRGQHKFLRESDVTEAQKRAGRAANIFSETATSGRAIGAATKAFKDIVFGGQ